LGNSEKEYFLLIKEESNDELISYLSFCRGKAYEKLENKKESMIWYQHSFFKNPYNFEVNK
jgi:hypothetical protein